MNNKVKSHGKAKPDEISGLKVHMLPCHGLTCLTKLIVTHNSSSATVEDRSGPNSLKSRHLDIIRQLFNV